MWFFAANQCALIIWWRHFAVNQLTANWSSYFLRVILPQPISARETYDDVISIELKPIIKQQATHDVILRGLRPISVKLSNPPQGRSFFSAYNKIFLLNWNFLLKPKLFCRIFVDLQPMCPGRIPANFRMLLLENVKNANSYQNTTDPKRWPQFIA